MAGPVASWNTIPVFGTYKKIDGGACTGRITFTFEKRVVNNVDGVIFPKGGKIIANLNGLGSFLINEFPAVDDPDNTPSNWSIKVTEELVGGVGEEYYIQPTLDMLPTGLDLRSVIITESTTPPPALIRSVAGGVAGLNSDGKVIDADGTEVSGSGGGGGGPFYATDIIDSTTVGRNLIKAVDAPGARATIGAGTSSLVIGTGAGNAKAGNYVPAWNDITSKPDNITNLTSALLAKADLDSGTGKLKSTQIPSGMITKIGTKTGPEVTLTMDDVTDLNAALSDLAADIPSSAGDIGAIPDTVRITTDTVEGRNRILTSPDGLRLIIGPDLVALGPNDVQIQTNNAGLPAPIVVGRLATGTTTATTLDVPVIFPAGSGLTQIPAGWPVFFAFATGDNDTTMTTDDRSNTWTNIANWKNSASPNVTLRLDWTVIASGKEMTTANKFAAHKTTASPLACVAIAIPNAVSASFDTGSPSIDTGTTGTIVNDTAVLTEHAGNASLAFVAVNGGSNLNPASGSSWALISTIYTGGASNNRTIGVYYRPASVDGNAPSPDALSTASVPNWTSVALSVRLP